MLAPCHLSCADGCPTLSYVCLCRDSVFFLFCSKLGSQRPPTSRLLEPRQKMCALGKTPAPTKKIMYVCPPVQQFKKKMHLPIFFLCSREEGEKKTPANTHARAPACIPRDSRFATLPQAMVFWQTAFGYVPTDWLKSMPPIFCRFLLKKNASLEPLWNEMPWNILNENWLFSSFFPS